MKCKNCNENDAVKYSKYSTGEFCNRKCARTYATKNKRKEINEKVSKKLKGIKPKEYVLKNLEIGRSGHIITEETKKKISIALKGRIIGRKKIEKLYKNCIECGKEFLAGNKGNKEALNKKTCSKECKNKFHSKFMAKKASDGTIKNRRTSCEYNFKNKTIKCDSKIEYACLDYFEKKYEIINIKRSDIVIEYEFDGCLKHYNPDFEIETNNEYFIIECKTIIKNKFLNEKWRKYNEISKIKKQKLEEYANNNGIKSFWFTKEIHRKFYDSLKI
jgi:hypothetical protein